MFIGLALIAQATALVVAPTPEPGDEVYKLSFKIKVSQQGTAKNCSIVKSSGSAEIDGLVCKKLIEKGRFNPEKDKDRNLVEYDFEKNLTFIVQK